MGASTPKVGHSVLQSFSNSLECEVQRHWLWCAYRLDAIGVTPSLAKAVPVFCCCCNCCGVCFDPSRVFLRPRKFFLSPGSRMPVCTTGGNSGLTSWEVEGLQLLVEILLQWQRRCSKTDIPQHPPGQYLGGVWSESFQSWTRDESLQIRGGGQTRNFFCASFVMVPQGSELAALDCCFEFPATACNIVPFSNE